MQTAVLAVDESFKCFRFKKQTNTYVEYKCVSQMPRMVNFNLNKQFLRISLPWRELCPVSASYSSAITEDKLNWNKTPPAPRLPRDVIEKTSAEYLEALRRLTGLELA